MKDVTSHSQLSGHFTNFRRKKEKENAEKIPTIPEQQDLLGEKFKPSSPTRLQFSTGGPSYHENKCVWCIKNPTRKTGKLMV